LWHFGEGLLRKREWMAVSLHLVRSPFTGSSPREQKSLQADINILGRLEFQHFPETKHHHFLAQSWVVLFV
jgi:hypothetical protein